ncbi:hypothetical protein ACN261_00490 [Micromonospora sp. WMMD723]|uniref:hypothetical protein n=1 Tax=unclassified Micromonospora TaxID=2617518 RepID=UPI003B959FCE
MEEQGMVENPDSKTTSDAGTTTTTTSKPQKIGPGPGTPPDQIGPGPGAPPADDNGK